MVRKLLAASALLATAVVAWSAFVGCGETLTESEESVPEDGGADTSPSDATVSDGVAPPNDGGDGSTLDASTCDVINPPGTYYQASFETTCEGWQVNPGTITPMTDQARCGTGSCKVCFNVAGEAILTRDVFVEKDGGTFELVQQLRDDTYAGAINGNVYIFDDGGGQMGYGGNPIYLDGGSWQTLQVIAQNVNGASSRAWLRMVAIGDGTMRCFYVDEVRLGHY